jgi:hypothetical protein
MANERLRHQFILDFTEFLTGYGFLVDDALKSSKEFYEKNESKIKDTLAFV